MNVQSLWANCSHYARVYKRFLETCLAESTSFRLHFFLLIFVDLCFYASTLFSVDFLYRNVSHVGIWNREQFMFFISVILGIDQWHMTFISQNFWLLPFQIRTGAFDFVLLRPIGSLFIVFFRNIRPANFLNILITWPLIISTGLKIGLGLKEFLMLPFLMLLGFMILVQIEIMISTLTFWMIEGAGLNFLRMEIQRVSRWPDYIYPSLARKFFLVFVPILLVGNAPVRFLLNSSDWGPLLGLIWANLFFAFGLKVLWKKAILRYESASS